MTPAEISAIKPGPELDRAVCENVFFEYVGDYADGSQMIDAGSAAESPVPAFSTTWAGLGLVVEEMERRGWELELRKETEAWIAGFRLHTVSRYAYAGSPCAAACLAALLAIEAERAGRGA